MNAPRGEAQINVEGTRHRLCLTLGGLAALETAFACASLSELTVRLKSLSAQEMRRVLSILVDQDLGESAFDNVSPADAARAIGEAFCAALG